MEMFNPPHPGEIVREDCIKAAGLTVTEAAMRLGVSRQSMSELINGRNGVSADMALRLERAGWGSAEGWVRNQGAYDLWQARHREEIAAAGERFKVRLKAHRKTTTQPKSTAQKAAEKEATQTRYRKTKKAAAAKRAAPSKRRALGG